jgi:hypothetical protein
MNALDFPEQNTRAGKTGHVSQIRIIAMLPTGKIHPLPIFGGSALGHSDLGAIPEGPRQMLPLGLRP